MHCLEYGPSVDFRVHDEPTRIVFWTWPSGYWDCEHQGFPGGEYCYCDIRRFFFFFFFFFFSRCI